MSGDQEIEFQEIEFQEIETEDQNYCKNFRRSKREIETGGRNYCKISGDRNGPRGP